MKVAIHTTLFHSISTDLEHQHFNCPIGEASSCLLVIKYVKNPLSVAHLSKSNIGVKRFSTKRLLPSNEFLKRLDTECKGESSQHLEQILKRNMRDITSSYYCGML
ncbi:hypothetical protein NPIL_28241 [Nephila pilipes]|uniref:Uncharacterized protein n=1 Tax=Nephila pilipes TaxID=299642 RepID=A0A8X6MYJ5_NEPPI|nr:hypothetical protein NPIL_28241 [Nephila pilipes]